MFIEIEQKSISSFQSEKVILFGSGGKGKHVLGRYPSAFFGIRGKAWDPWNIYNKYWISPKNLERLKGYLSVKYRKF